MSFYFNHRVKILLLLGILLIFFCLIPIKTLVVGIQQENDMLIIPMLKEKAFSLNYVHSVQKTPVQENFILAPEDNTLILTSTEFQSLGVGLPFLEEEGHFVNTEGLFVITEINRPFAVINLAFMPLAQQSLNYNNIRYEFKDYFEPGTLIRIEVKDLSPAQLILNNFHGKKEALRG